MLIDFKDAYLTLGLHPAHRKYCRFRSPDGKRYQWKVVSFGTSEAPKICTKMMKPLIQILKSLGIRCLIYIDDILILDQCKYRLASAMALAMELFQSEVGLQLKISKGQLYPSQTIQCLGIIWNTATMQCSIPDKRIIAIDPAHSQTVAARVGSFSDGYHARLRSLRGTGGLNHPSHPTSEASPPLHPARAEQGRAERRVAWSVDPLKRSARSSRVVDDGRGVAGKRQRHSPADSPNPVTDAHRCGNQQRGLRGSPLVRRQVFCLFGRRVT